ncbi:HpcH/HpaI aldolase family protein [Sinanaerobacter chloroacetimidivorans]|jgi:4-hydroxy-2-oxoheptanedioate aldolase|uniref:HpcH/HpaI aldolase/citrate lyase domain-containing protein n=1 Tax=Sinanaerobacter chloroacetimidivorans TaxID=2818044 RepID=A0A8J7W2L4_9FIRM|nr:aldolase/citrate lyase family protein [Sinanaerobacter chloroacetimidivorans]MBR0598023.1 hypothetical protein [Sinanaerobacter chloroacetimidivorans]
MINDKLMTKLNNGDRAFGTFVKINSTAVIEMLGQKGFDFAIIDREHSVFSDTDVEKMIMAADVWGLPVIIRTPGNAAEHILHALDSGASGIQVPDISSVSQIYKIIENAKYYPEGSRGLSFAQRAAGYGFQGGNEYIEKSNQNTVIAVHIENREIAEKIDEVCSIPQLDVVFVGPADLSQSMGKPGKTDDPEVVALIENVFRVAIKNNKKVGIYVGTEEAIKKYADLGATYFAWKSDVLLLNEGIRSSENTFKKI